MRLKDLSKADQFCPIPTHDPYWNESSWFSFSIPERKFHGFIYYFFRPNMNLLVGGPAIWDPSGCHSKRYRIRYDKLGCQIDLEWTAIADANEFEMEQHAYGASTERRFHIEQAGRVTAPMAAASWVRR
jgi:hypothetical protein